MLSVIFGLILVAVLDEFSNTWVYALSLPMFVLFSMVNRDVDWREIGRILYRLLASTPKAVYEGVYVLVFRTEDAFEVLDVDEDDETSLTLSITLTPRTVVVLNERDRLHVHVLGRDAG